MFRGGRSNQNQGGPNRTGNSSGSGPSNSTRNADADSESLAKRLQQEEDDAVFARNLQMQGAFQSLSGGSGLGVTFPGTNLGGGFSGLPPGIMMADPAENVEGCEEMVLVACEIEGDSSLGLSNNSKSGSAAAAAGESAAANRVTVEMMVDTGAQNSVISSGLVSKLGLWGKVNTSRQGVASGVGTAKIKGRLELVTVQLGHVEFQLNFNVIELQQSEHTEELLLLGIDQLRRFKCILDLERNVLVFGGKGGVEVPLLPDVDRRMQRRRSKELAGCQQM